MNACPTPEVLRQVLDGTLGAAEADAVGRHLEGCARCQEVLDRASDDPAVPRWPGALADRTAVLPGPSLERVVQDLCILSTDLLPAGAPGGPPPSFLGPPRRGGDLGTLGPYRILAEVGRGGMGIVYRGYDDTLQRKVAVKVVRPELAGPATRARLLVEARAAARFAHDHAVRVHAVDSTADGLPYLVLEYLEGPTLSQRLASPPALAPRQAAALAAQVADALAAAHAAGLVHRDVKPGNVILEPPAGRARLLDFGLARLGDGGGLTLEGALAGTPAYMSPEQVRGGPVDARSDVYGLGATLYEALTGTAPFRGSAPRVLNQVLHEEPRPPRQLNDAVPRDLETICQKALAKEPGRRYQAAREMADDLNAFLEGRPIRARPLGLLGRGWRWCRRRPLVAGLAAGLVAVFLAGFAGVFSQWRRAETHLAASREEHQRAEENFREALDAVNRFYTQVSESRLLNEPGMQPLRRDLLATAREYFERFARERRDDPALQIELGRALVRLGHIVWLIDSPEKAQGYYEQALEVQERLAAENPGDFDRQAELAQTLNSLGNACTETSQFERATAFRRRGLSLSQRLADEYPGRPEGWANLGRLNNNLGLLDHGCGREAEAEAEYRRAIAAWSKLAEDHPDEPQYRGNRAGTSWHLATLYREQGRLADAEALLGEVLPLAEAGAREQPRVPGWQQLLACCAADHHVLAAIAAQSEPPGRAARGLAEAASAFRAPLGRMRQVAEANPALTDPQWALALLLTWSGRIEQALGRAGRAEADFREALAIGERLEREYHSGMTLNWAALSVRIHLAGLLGDTGRIGEALEVCGQADRGLDVPTGGTRHAYFGSLLRPLCVHRAVALWQQGGHAEAVAAWDRLLTTDGSKPRTPWESPEGQRHRHLWAASRALADARRTGGGPAALLRDVHAAAIKDAEDYLKSVLLSGGEAYWLALVCAAASSAAAGDERLPAPERVRQAEHAAARAVALLGLAHTAGWFRPPGRAGRLAKDCELDALRGRGDFQELLRAVASEAAAKTGG
jgi:serine/threonine-protein kinase